MPLVLWCMYCSGLSTLTSCLVVPNRAAACSCQGPGSLLPRDPLLLLRLPGLCGCVGGDKGRPAGGHSEQLKGPPPRGPAGVCGGEEWGGRSAREGCLCRGDQADPTCPCLSNSWPSPGNLAKLGTPHKWPHSLPYPGGLVQGCNFSSHLWVGWARLEKT